MVQIVGENVILRNIIESDLFPLWQMIYDQESPEWKKWDAPYYPMDRIDYEHFVKQMKDRLVSDEDVPSRMVIATKGGELIGSVSYYWEHKESLWMEVGFVIYKPKFWNGGYGTEALKLWIDHLFASMPLVRIGLTTWSGNHRMIRCAEKLGMKMEARIRKARLYEGKFYDSIRMGVLREEWGVSRAVDDGTKIDHPATKGFSHVTVDVSDLEKSLDFYVRTLGMKLIHKGRRDAYLEWGSAWVCLQERPELSPPTPHLGVDHVAFYIAPDDFHAVVEVLRQANVPIVRGPIQRGGGWTVNFLDPDGTQLEFHTGTLTERMKVWT
jgi:RimJ/RimL family protein N-acetyltransferase/catechol 2,3-dioxygenase-like lactoylglutathione lyase family enzyme